jgi:hypothetical protein
MMALFTTDTEFLVYMDSCDPVPTQHLRRRKLARHDGRRVRYLDTFVKRDGVWLLTERRLMLDWTETRPLTSGWPDGETLE